MMEVKLEKFEGPLGLLLQLIEKEELDITEICLAKIADQYINYIKQADNINPDEMADFLVVAAKLLLIKSKALLPYLFPEEEKEIQEFENQLKMYREYMEAVKKISQIIGKKKFMFAREFNRSSLLSGARLFSPPPSLKAADLAMVFCDIINRLIPMEKLEEEVLERKINIEEKIMLIEKMLIERIKFSFNQLMEKADSKTDIIVSFLAMLELVKQKTIVAEQGELFSEILINKYE